MSMAYHTALDIRVGLSSTKKEAVRTHLHKELAKGRLVLPIGKPCAGWSYLIGCPGHDATFKWRRTE